MNEDWTDEKRACWDRLSTYDFDDPAHQLNFTNRLARENRWSHDFAARVVDEYRRFCWLAVYAGHPITPSDAVDQVWHLHLTYSRDYWERFCPEILGKDFHHGPTKGGVAESGKFTVWYGKTLLSYRDAFGEYPADIWPKPTDRFENVDQFVRINRAEVMIIPRPPLSTRGLLLCGLTMLMLFFFTLAASIDSLQFVGSFLGLLTLVALIGAALRILEPPALKRRGQPNHSNSGCAGGGGNFSGTTSGSKAGSDAGDGGAGCGGCGG